MGAQGHVTIGSVLRDLDMTGSSGFQRQRWQFISVRPAQWVPTMTESDGLILGQAYCIEQQI